MDSSKPTPPATGKISSFTGEHRFLSNFYPCLGSSVEHLYQSLKCSDLEEARAVMTSPTPGQAKRLGRKVSMRPDWEQVKISIMTELVRMKFRDPDLRSRLLATGDDLGGGGRRDDRHPAVRAHVGGGVDIDRGGRSCRAPAEQAGNQKRRAKERPHGCSPMSSR